MITFIIPQIATTDAQQLAEEVINQLNDEYQRLMEMTIRQTKRVYKLSHISRTIIQSQLSNPETSPLKKGNF